MPHNKVGMKRRMLPTETLQEVCDIHNICWIPSGVVVHLILLSRLVLNKVQENIDRGFAVLGCWAISVAVQKGDKRKTKPGNYMVKWRTWLDVSVSARHGISWRPSYKTGTLRTTDFAPWTPSTANSPSRLVFP